MDHGNLVEALYAALNRGDSEFVLQHVTPDVEWVEFGPNSIPFTGAHHGRDSVARMLATLTSTQSRRRMRVTELLTDGETVVATIRFSGLVNTTGRMFDTSAAHFFTFRNGKVQSFRGYFDTAQLASAYSRIQCSAAA